MTRLVCWDLDETLGYFRPFAEEVMARFQARQRGVTGKLGDALGRLVGRDSEIKPTEGAFLRDGIGDVLAGLQAAGFTQVVTTGSFHEYAVLGLERLGLAGYFAEDGVYFNMPAAPVNGRENVEKFIAGFIGAWTETIWDVLHIMGDGDVVIAERLDRTKAGDKAVDLPCVGVFELEAGKIKVWRDYFDMATYAKGMS